MFWISAILCLSGQFCACENVLVGLWAQKNKHNKHKNEQAHFFILTFDKAVAPSNPLPASSKISQVAKQSASENTTRASHILLLCYPDTFVMMHYFRYVQQKDSQHCVGTFSLTHFHLFLHQLLQHRLLQYYPSFKTITLLQWIHEGGTVRAWTLQFIPTRIMLMRSWNCSSCWRLRMQWSVATRLVSSICDCAWSKH